MRIEGLVVEAPQGASRWGQMFFYTFWCIISVLSGLDSGLLMVSYVWSMKWALNGLLTDGGTMEED